MKAAVRLPRARRMRTAVWAFGSCGGLCRRCRGRIVGRQRELASGGVDAGGDPGRRGVDAVEDLLEAIRDPDLDQVTVAADELRYQAVGQTQDNVAITVLQARRTYENPDEVHVFAVLANYRPLETTVDVEIAVDGQLAAVRPMTLSVNTSMILLRVVSCVVIGNPPYATHRLQIGYNKSE